MSNPPKRRKLSSNDLPTLCLSVSPPPTSPEKSLPIPAPSSNDPLQDYFREGNKGQALDADHPLTITISDTEDGEDITGEGFRKGLPKKEKAAAGIARTSRSEAGAASTKPASGIRAWESPFKLTHIEGLPDSENAGTVKLEDILGDVMLDEVWIFNYMHDIPWVMSKFDPDIVNSVKVTFVHGNWKDNDESRIQMEKDAQAWPNVTVKAAYMPEMFGTHHTKMMILFRRDDLAQVVIHTANMIPFDWANMTQAVWLSPLLPLNIFTPKSSTSNYAPPPTIGDKFKRDLTAYLAFYGFNRTGALVTRLAKYSFTSIRAIFISSVPGRHSVTTSPFGWPKLQKELSRIPVSTPSRPKLLKEHPNSTSTTIPARTNRPKILCQISSIATLGASDTWLTPIFFNALTKTSSTHNTQKPELGIIFPTPDEIRASINGYASGSSIHFRLSSPQQIKALEYIKPLLYHWSTNTSPYPPPSPPPPVSRDPETKSSGRNLAAPHVKTYIRFAGSAGKEQRIDWALLTSANLSTQAWGAAPRGGEVRVCSYEVGVLVHPGLWAERVEGGDDGTDDQEEMVMRPVFKRNECVAEEGEEGEGCDKVKGVVALRLPYSVPVRKYKDEEEPWVAGGTYRERDRHGMRWVDGFFSE
ncbi:phospholipase D/nuclease [Ascodesmis nigricans]|uniref:Phospholipase D/nuclease n=1 Tax=Ascodesmis nigricans TaxID=341454 RepID=A0A4V3SIU5_9PEZI|nr:phospholipase D/nuclease [Ascodesmis nigricans]